MRNVYLVLAATAALLLAPTLASAQTPPRVPRFPQFRNGFAFGRGFARGVGGAGFGARGFGVNPFFVGRGFGARGFGFRPQFVPVPFAVQPQYYGVPVQSFGVPYGAVQSFGYSGFANPGPFGQCGVVY